MSAGQLNLDKDAFLAQHWQRKPLLIRDAVTAFHSPLPADELAGLALEEHIESRIIEYRDGDWHVHHGPFSAEDFQRETPWTLLVQAVDHYIPAVAQLRQLVDFLPQWRVDDVMVSYAVDGGSVGPHFDNYDVFLLQGEGQRRWQLGQFCDSTSPLLPNEELRILRDFHRSEEYLLGPGDILYVPPGVAHWGIAQGECTTFSIGFRAPRMNTVVSRWADNLLQELDPDLFYTDRQSEPVKRAGEIRREDVQRLRAQLQSVLDQDYTGHWFGEMVTEPRGEWDSDEDEAEKNTAALATGPRAVALVPAARVAWQQENSGIVVFSNGESRLFSDRVRESLVILCEHWRLQGDALSRALAQADSASMLEFLVITGGIYVD